MFITKMEIENFMSIGRAEIEFDDSNIISLCGYNDSGKSAVIRLLDIMLFFSYFREQAKFIKDGESYFKGTLHFSDGVVYEFKKLASGQSLFTLSKDDNVLFTNTTGSSIISVSDVPKPIADYLGVLKDEVTGEKLNVRRCTDRLFLINTSGGDNYKILNVILQSDVLSETSINLNTDKNKLMSEITTGVNQMSAIKAESDTIHTASEEVLNELESSLAEFRVKKSSCEELSKIFECYKFIQNTVIPNELTSISTDRLSSLQRMGLIFKKASSVVPDELFQISSERIKALEKIKGVFSRTNTFIPTELQYIDGERLERARALCVVSNRLSKITSAVGVEYPVLKSERYSQIDKLQSLLNTVNSLNEVIDSGEKRLNSERDRLHLLCKENDIACCPECGAVFKEEG